jgi:peptide deformylase
VIIKDESKLRVKCSDVLPEEIAGLKAKLEKELSESPEPGYGLSAPQIGIPKRMAIVRVEGKSIDLVNAKIESAYDRFLFEKEGCLSFPGMYVDTMRYREIVVVNDVEPKRFIATDLLAVVAQHEINHLESILLPDVAIRKKPRPNDLCYCGSNRKYKKCHGA